MNPYNLFFYITCSIVLNFCSFLFAYNDGGNEFLNEVHHGLKAVVSTSFRRSQSSVLLTSPFISSLKTWGFLAKANKRTSVDNEIEMLVNNICILLQYGHSTDEVIKIFFYNYKHSYDIQKLVKHIDLLLSKKYSEEQILKIIVNNKNYEKFYKRKNFWTKIKNYYFVLKIAVILTIIIIVAYLLSYYLGFSRFSCLRDMSTSGSNQKSNATESSYLEQLLTPDSDSEDHSGKLQAEENQKEQNLDIDLQVQQEALQTCQDAFRVQNIQSIFDQPKQTNPFGKASVIQGCDNELYKEIEDRIAHAKSIGFETPISPNIE